MASTSIFSDSDLLQISQWMALYPDTPREFIEAAFLYCRQKPLTGKERRILKRCSKDAKSGEVVVKNRPEIKSELTIETRS